jgi:hypothetical protein
MGKYTCGCYRFYQLKKSNTAIHICPIKILMTKKEAGKNECCFITFDAETIKTTALKKIAPDKWKHFYTGIIIGIVLQAFVFFLLPEHPYLATAIVFVIIAGISYGFELFSLFTGRGHYDFMDAVASVIGGLLGMAASFTYLFYR